MSFEILSPSSMQLVNIANEIRFRTTDLHSPLKIAVCGKEQPVSESVAQSRYGVECRYVLLFIDLRDHLDDIGDGYINVSIYTDKKELSSFDFLVQEKVQGRALASKKHRDFLLDWSRDKICCPKCHGNIDWKKNRKFAECWRCGVTYDQKGFYSINLMDAGETEQFKRTSIVGQISAHDYSGDVLDFIHSHDDGQIILDCGAGLRKNPRDNIINVDIFDFPSTHVLGNGTALPFADSSFDAVLSLAVLEHINDPFAAARELIRVTKPGGRLFIGMPFLQPEHGYPFHFFNATRMGVRQLFQGDTSVVKQMISDRNHPVHMLYEMVGKYKAALPADVRRQFGDLTISEFLSKKPRDRILEDEPMVRALPEEWCWKLASGSQLIVKKDG